MTSESTKWNLLAVKLFLSIILSFISLPAAVHRQGMILLHNVLAWVMKLGRLSVHAISQFASSGRPHWKSFLRVSRLRLDVDVRGGRRDSGVCVWRVVAKKTANWRISADETLMQVLSCACQEFLIPSRVSKGGCKKLFSVWRLLVKECWKRV